jgi:hypothetical protein
MARIIIGFGLLLILVGVIAYFATGRESITALLPAIAGIPVLIAGYLASRPGTQAIGEYGAIALAALLALGTLRGVTALIGGDVSVASVVNTGLLIVSVIFVVYAVRVVWSRAPAETDL